MMPSASCERLLATHCGVDEGTHCALPTYSTWLSFKKARLGFYDWVDMWLQDISLSLASHLTSLVVIGKLCSGEL